MTRVPHARSSFQSPSGGSGRHPKSSKDQVAGQRMAKGDYTSAEALVTTAREIGQFQSELDTMAHRWREVCAAGGRCPWKATDYALVAVRPTNLAQS